MKSDRQYALIRLLLITGAVLLMIMPITSPAGNGMIITDFEDSKMDIFTYAGSSSSVTAEYQSAVVHGGKQAARITEKISDWGGAGFTLSSPKGDWSGYKKLKMWIFGGNSGKKFSIDLEEAGKEQHRYTMSDDWKGWKEIVINISDFKVRSDWQPDDAKKNGKLDFPLKNLHLFTSNQFNSELVFDDISVEN
jgi:hypothetical protein